MSMLHGVRGNRRRASHCQSPLYRRISGPLPCSVLYNLPHLNKITEVFLDGIPVGAGQLNNLRDFKLAVLFEEINDFDTERW